MMITEKKIQHFYELNPMEKGAKLLSFPRKTRSEILEKLPVKKIVDIIKFLDPIRTSKVLRDISSRKQHKVIKQLEEKIQEKIKMLLKFHHGSIGALLSFDYIQISKADTVEDVHKLLVKHERQNGKVPAILVTDQGNLIGEVSFKDMLSAKRNTSIAKLVKKVSYIHCNENEEKALTLFREHHHSKIAVLSDDGSILGVVHADDVLHLIDNQTSKSLNKFAGVNKEEDISDKPFVKVKYRYGWLLINLFTAFMAAATIGVFQDTISRLVFLAAFLPIVAGMGGNAATQTLAVTVRGIALNEIDPQNVKAIIKNEALAGITNGVITGSVAAFIAVLAGQSALLGLILALAMIFNLFIAGFFGTLIPLFMKKIGKDPATSATIFITTATDIFGFFAFLTLATLLM